MFIIVIILCLSSRSCWSQLRFGDKEASEILLSRMIRVGLCEYQVVDDFGRAVIVSECGSGKTEHSDGGSGWPLKGKCNQPRAEGETRAI